MNRLLSLSHLCSLLPTQARPPKLSASPHVCLVRHLLQTHRQLSSGQNDLASTCPPRPACAVTPKCTVPRSGASPVLHSILRPIPVPEHCPVVHSIFRPIPRSGALPGRPFNLPTHPSVWSITTSSIQFSGSSLGLEHYHIVHSIFRPFPRSGTLPHRPFNLPAHLSRPLTNLAIHSPDTTLILAQQLPSIMSSQPSTPSKAAMPEPSPQEARFFFSIIKNLMNKPDIDWHAVATDNNMKNAKVAAVSSISSALPTSPLPIPPSPSPAQLAAFVLRARDAHATNRRASARSRRSSALTTPARAPARAPPRARQLHRTRHPHPRL